MAAWACRSSANSEALARYREMGEVWAEWNCSPEPGDGDDFAPVAATP
ncbi:hypothetical protein [Streptomyces sp. FH025]|nr:hypothetical protein [Streptomyces sp. FH025]MBO1415902.1 hypothetical protein [Streptomyces sp. FH025]